MSDASVTLRRCTDTHASLAAPSRAFPDARRLSLKSGEAYAYLHFGWRVPLEAIIVSATLRVYTQGAWGTGSKTLTVHRILGDWQASTLTWNERPTLITTGTAALTKTSNVDGDEWAIDVTAQMQAVSDGARWHGLRISTTATTLLYLNSSQAGESTPILEVVWSEAPGQPTVLSPSGGRAVSVARPVVRCDFTDDLGSTAMQAIHVQINATNVWTAPTFDSGPVLTTEPQLDLATTTFVAMTNAQTVFWRVRVQDGAGLWSPWSDATSFVRRTKAAVTINNPAAAPNDHVSEWTPPIAWALGVGRTQTGYQVIITKADRPDRIRYDSGRLVGAAAAHTLPPGVLVDDVAYQVIVRLWDEYDRESTPGDPTYGQAERLFTFDESATVGVVSSLVATKPVNTPDVVLTWNRSTQPDGWAVLRNGRVLATDLTGADLFVSGTSYTYKDRNPPPRKALTYTVQPIVNGLTAASNPTVTVTTTPQGIWLADPDRDLRRVCILPEPDGSRAASQWSMGEQSATFTPPGLSEVVRVTQQLRGWEGTVSGVLMEYAGKTAAEWQANLFEIRDSPDQPLLLAVGHDSIRVVVGNIVSPPIGEDPANRVLPVTFEFWQVTTKRAVSAGLYDAPVVDFGTFGAPGGGGFDGGAF